MCRFIHPALAYGALTTLPPCSALTVRVQLLDIDAQSSGVLPPLKPLDLSWVRDASLYKNIEESLTQQPYFSGSFYRELLNNQKEGLSLNLTIDASSDR